MDGDVPHMREERNAYNVLFGMPEGQRPLGRGRNRWESNITLDFNEIRWGVVDCVGLAQDRDTW